MDAISSNIASTGTGVTSAKPASAAGAISSDFETFLKMLTTQMQNQDPLDPMQSTDLSVQLATFSGVEQQVKTNDLLKDLSAQMSISALSDLSSWVGMEARSAGPQSFEGAPISLVATAPVSAETAHLIVQDRSGREVQRLQIGAGTQNIEWAGTDASGAPLPADRYSFSVEAESNGAPLPTDPVQGYARVMEVRADPTGAVLVFRDGRESSVSDVTALRLP